ncbi:MAG: DNA polymerase IV [Clostridia bacterium]|nr:DNA polymerase IV [Clostridia bacterium]
MRVILHADLNNFYASVETKLNPELAGKNVGVCGNVENRHGIILAKSEGAKKLGVKTGMTINDAKHLCPDIVLVEAKHSHYTAYSKLVKDIYRDYTDRIESFGIDECWLDVTESVKLFGSGEKIADTIRERVKNEIGLTVSVGVSFNKVFAKLGSDLKKPDGTTVISVDNYKQKVWQLPVEDLLFVGKSTAQKLKKINVKTIGDLARIDVLYLEKHFGKWGVTLSDYANGKDDAPVLKDAESTEIKSVGNSITSYRDLTTIEDVKIMFTALSETVSSRVISYGLGSATTLSIYVRDSFLNSSTRQGRLHEPSVLPEDFKNFAIELFNRNYDLSVGIRTIGLSVSGFDDSARQISLDGDFYEKKLKLNGAISDIKGKYGNQSVVKGIVLKDKKLVRDDGEGTSLDRFDL